MAGILFSGESGVPGETGPDGSPQSRRSQVIGWFTDERY
jgi:hypothetical protein